MIYHIFLSKGRQCKIGILTHKPLRITVQQIWQTKDSNY